MNKVILSILILIAFLVGAFFAYSPDKVITLDGSALSQESALVTKPATKAVLLFTGDIMLSRSVGAKMAKEGDYTFPFARIADYLKNADLTFGNLETPVSSRGVKVGSIYSFRSDPRSLEGLNRAGFDIVSIANNHMWDYGRVAFTDTLMHLREAGIDYAGGGNNFEEAHRPVIRDVKGIKIAFLAYTEFLQSVVAGPNSPGITKFDPEQIKKDIVAAKEKSDLVVVSFHWGDEYKTTHNARQEKFAKIAVDSGADLIIGHHPHVVQELEKLNDSWVVYSLGNFVFDQAFSKATMEGALLRVELENGKITNAEKIPVYINSDFQPGLEP